MARSRRAGLGDYLDKTVNVKSLIFTQLKPHLTLAPLAPRPVSTPAHPLIPPPPQYSPTTRNHRHPQETCTKSPLHVLRARKPAPGPVMAGAPCPSTGTPDACLHCTPCCCLVLSTPERSSRRGHTHVRTEGGVQRRTSRVTLSSSWLLLSRKPSVQVLRDRGKSNSDVFRVSPLLSFKYNCTRYVIAAS